jgi:hypothetical protein
VYRFTTSDLWAMDVWDLSFWCEQFRQIKARHG